MTTGIWKNYSKFTISEMQWNGPFQKCNGILGTSLFWLNFIGQDVIYEDAEIAQCVLRGLKLNFWISPLWEHHFSGLISLVKTSFTRMLRLQNVFNRDKGQISESVHFIVPQGHKEHGIVDIPRQSSNRLQLVIFTRFLISITE